MIWLCVVTAISALAQYIGWSPDELRSAVSIVTGGNDELTLRHYYSLVDNPKLGLKEGPQSTNSCDFMIPKDRLRLLRKLAPPSLFDCQVGYPFKARREPKWMAVTLRPSKGAKDKLPAVISQVWSTIDSLAPFCRELRYSPVPYLDKGKQVIGYDVELMGLSSSGRNQWPYWFQLSSSDPLDWVSTKVGYLHDEIVNQPQGLRFSSVPDDTETPPWFLKRK